MRDSEGEIIPQSPGQQDHAIVDTWADLLWSYADDLPDRQGIFTRIAAVTNPVKGGSPLTIYQMISSTIGPGDYYWMMVGSEFVTKKGQTNPRYFDTIEAACWLYSWLHPEQKEPTNETDSKRREGGIHRSSYGYSAFDQRS
jgi:hypothetical protein